MTEAVLDIRPDHLKIVLDILARHVPDREVWAFGSRATWKTKDYSDLDLAIIGDEALPLKLSAALSDDFAESDLPFKVDVVDWATTSESFREIIKRDRVVVRDVGVVSPIGRYPSHWKVAQLADITLKIGSGSTPPGGEAVYLPTRRNFGFVRSQCVHDRYFDVAAISFISDEDAAHLQGVRLQKDDILLNITGDGVTFSRACAVPIAILPACVNQHVAIIRPDPSKLDSGYLLSYLTHKQTKSYIESFNAGGSRRAITKGHIEKFLLPLPPLREQVSIARTLGALDDKIDLNRRMNETLEAMARALFKSWFVDFDQDQPGYQESMPEQIESPLSDMIELIGGGTPSTSNQGYWGGDIPWFSVADAPSSSDVFVNDTEKTITRLGLENSSTRMLPEHTTIVTARGTVGKVALTARPMAMNQSCYGIRGKDGRPAYFTYFLVRSCIQGLQARTHGSVFDTITRATFDAITVNDPGIAAAEAFDAAVDPIMSKIKANNNQSRTLAALRDLLLPRLLSGQLRLKDAEKMVADAV